MSSSYKTTQDETVRLFKSDFFEFFTRVHPSLPVILYLPLILYLLVAQILDANMTWAALPFLFVSGLACWTIFEYCFHRFIFHFQPKGPLSKRIFYLFHGIHHDYPNDSKRLVMPPIISIPLAFFFYYFFKEVLGNAYFRGFFAGFGLGYLIYDLTHYAIHHLHSKGKLFGSLKRNHLTHHYKRSDRYFGVSNPLWDWVFKTYR